MRCLTARLYHDAGPGGAARFLCVCVCVPGMLKSSGKFIGEERERKQKTLENCSVWSLNEAKH